MFKKPHLGGVNLHICIFRNWLEYISHCSRLKKHTTKTTKQQQLPTKTKTLILKLLM